LELKRRLGFWDATLIVAGSMIGSGVFIVSADMARLTGSAGWLLSLWIASGVITLMAALNYAELSGMMPEAGGQFVYIRKSWGKLSAFLYGWTVLMVIQTGVIAAVAVAFARFSAVLFPQLDSTAPLIPMLSNKALVSISSIVLLTWINSKGVQGGAFVQKLFTTSKIIALLILIVAGLWVGSKMNFLEINFQNPFDASLTQTGPDGSLKRYPLQGFALMVALGTAMIGSLFSSDAWNNVTFIAGEIKDPAKNLPRSLIAGTAVVTLLYVLANLAYLSLLPLEGQPNTTEISGQGIQFAGNGSDRVGTAAAFVIMGEQATILMAILIMISTFGCNNGIILSGARVYYAMAKEGVFFQSAGELNKSGVPAKALWFQALWASILCMSGSYSDLLDYTTFASLFFYIITIAGLIKLRTTASAASRPYRVPFYPFLPLAYIIIAACICLLLTISKPDNVLKGILIVASGLPVYYIWGKLKPTPYVSD
jgi:APA family basic amino acid/polyamine antiporter